MQLPPLPQTRTVFSRQQVACGEIAFGSAAPGREKVVRLNCKLTSHYEQD
jgi:hypothetical protein